MRRWGLSFWISRCIWNMFYICIFHPPSVQLNHTISPLPTGGVLIFLSLPALLFLQIDSRPYWHEYKHCMQPQILLPCPERFEFYRALNSTQTNEEQCVGMTSDKWIPLPSQGPDWALYWAKVGNMLAKRATDHKVWLRAQRFEVCIKRHAYYFKSSCNWWGIGQKVKVDVSFQYLKTFRGHVRIRGGRIRKYFHQMLWRFSDPEKV